MMRRSPTRLLLALALAAGGEGCALRPEPSADEVRTEMLANTHVPTAWSATALPASRGARSHWIESFDDPQLAALVAEAIAFNTDLRAAGARVERAAAYVKVAGGQLYPAVDVLGRAGIADSSDESGLQGVILSASWELDLWGRVRYGVRGAADQYAAAQADYSFARESLMALVAKSWFMATEATLQRDLGGEMVASASKLIELAIDRRRVGIGSEYDVVVARMNLGTYRDSLLQLELARAQSLRALEVLVGRYPSAEIGIRMQLPNIQADVPAVLPSELLERRPDVIAAERRVGAAFSRVQEARAARLPRISLTGSGSDLTSELFVLQDRDQPQWGIGGKIIAPLFSGGSLKAQVTVRTTEQQEAMAAYASTALKAFADVENALSSESSMRVRETVLAPTVADSMRALELALTRYRVGSGDLRAVEQQQLAYNGARMNLLRVQSEQRVQRVNLHLALGGDYTASR